LATKEERLDAKGNEVNEMAFNDKYSMVLISRVETEKEFNDVCANVPGSSSMDKITVTK
jgi:hypothetical protein